jgi:hypothetical protein
VTDHEDSNHLEKVLGFLRSPGWAGIEGLQQAGIVTEPGELSNLLDAVLRSQELVKACETLNWLRDIPPIRSEGHLFQVDTNDRVTMSSSDIRRILIALSRG